MAEESIEELEKRISELPRGSITKKTVKGNTYLYHRWSEDGKRRERYIPPEEIDDLRRGIEERKELESRLKRMKNPMPATGAMQQETFRLDVITGRELNGLSANIAGFRKRYCFDSVTEYLYDKRTDRVLILYGLRRTGKTTLMKQAISEMDDGQKCRTAFVTIGNYDSMSDLDHDLRILRKNGFCYVFVDEVTRADNFVESSSILSDRFASMGMKIILSGTDSLGFMLAEDDSLYDRCWMIHTTVIPYREFEGVLGLSGIDTYMEYGGTMSPDGVDYNRTADGGPNQYVNSAIAWNIQHSLAQYQYGGHFRDLAELYEKGELTNVINRVVEDINHRFTIDVLTREFSSNDFAQARNNLLKDDSIDQDAIENIDVPKMTADLKKLLDILDDRERSVRIEEVHAQEIEEYLKLMDVIDEIDVYTMFGNMSRRQRTVVTQPGLRYAQADALVNSLLGDDALSSLGSDERRYVMMRIRNGIRGRMMEDIILFETKNTFRDCKVFVLEFGTGEFDMVIADTGGCRIFEIKHSDKVVPQQYRHLVDAEKCDMTEYRFGKILERCVIYRGESHMENGIRYINAEEYLRSLHPSGRR